jgi:acylphosphatase
VGDTTRLYLISGKVQGVFFRHSTRIEAERLKLAGVARNLPDGRVEVIARGDSEALDQLRAWLAHGPGQARVDALEEAPVDEAPQIPESGRFVVR